MAYSREEEKQKLLNVTGEQIEEIVGKKAEIEKNTADIAELKENGMGDTALREEVEALDLKFQTEIGKVNGLAVKNQSDIVALWAWNEEIEADVADRYTKEETDSAITAKVSEIMAGAPEDFDTLKEMSDWLTEHSDTAATMNSAILANTNAITATQAGIEKKNEAIEQNRTDISSVNDKISSLTLGLHTDGLFYIFIDNEPIGNGISLPKASGDVYGNVDSENNIVLNGDLADGNYYIKYEMSDGSTIDIGELVLDNTVSYSVTNKLTNCKNSNTEATIAKGGTYPATITANSGYEISSIVVTMGGTDITSSAVSGGNINIGVVTGDIVITAVAEEKAVTEPVTVDIALTDGIRIGGDGGDRTQAGYCATPHIDLTNIPKPCTIHLTKAKWLVFDGESNTMIRVYAEKADGTQLISDVAKEGIGGSYFTIVDNSDIGNDVIVTITSNDVGYIRFSGHWTFAGASDSNSSFVAANTKATLTYAPVA